MHFFQVGLNLQTPPINMLMTGYVFVAERYRIASDLSLSFEFRTTRQNGVIISISHPTGMPALALEMVDGRVGSPANRSLSRFLMAMVIGNLYSPTSGSLIRDMNSIDW